MRGRERKKERGREEEREREGGREREWERGKGREGVFFTGPDGRELITFLQYINLAHFHPRQQYISFVISI